MATDQKRFLIRHLVEIAACELVGLLAVIAISADTRLTNFTSVKKTLATILPDAPVHPEFQLAASAIKRATTASDIVVWVVFLTSTITLLFCFLCLLRLRRCQVITKDKPTAPSAS
jgi:hypothetical protein